MRIIDRVSLIDKIGRELQTRFGFDDIDAFLGGFGLKASSEAPRNSKWAYSKSALAGADNDVVTQIARELEIETPPNVPSKPVEQPVKAAPSETDRLFALRNAILENFTGGNWTELGLITGCEDVVRNHSRLLRSLNFGDPDYEEHILPVLIRIKERDQGNLAKMEDFLSRRFSPGENISSGKKGGRVITFTPNVFEVPEEPVEDMLVSVMMPFHAGMTPVYAAIKAAAEDAGFKCQRADDIWNHSSVIQDVFSLIFRSFIIVCDFTGKNPNVFYEAGIAHTLGKHVVPITQSDGDIPFDLRHHRQLNYLANSEGLSDLRKALAERFRTLNRQR